MEPVKQILTLYGGRFLSHKPGQTEKSTAMRNVDCLSEGSITGWRLLKWGNGGCDCSSVRNKTVMAGRQDDDHDGRWPSASGAVAWPGGAAGCDDCHERGRFYEMHANAQRRRHNAEINNDVAKLNGAADKTPPGHNPPVSCSRTKHP